MNRKLIMVFGAIGLLGVSAVLATVVALGSASTGTAPVAAAPPDWVQSVVSKTVQQYGRPKVESAVWVLTNYAAAESRLSQQPGSSNQEEYLVVLTADTEFVGYSGFDPTGNPSRGKYIELLINVDDRLVDTFGIGNDVVRLDGLGQVYSYSVD